MIFNWTHIEAGCFPDGLFLDSTRPSRVKQLLRLLHFKHVTIEKGYFSNGSVVGSMRKPRVQQRLRHRWSRRPCKRAALSSAVILDLLWRVQFPNVTRCPSNPKNSCWAISMKWFASPPNPQFGIFSQSLLQEPAQTRLQSTFLQVSQVRRGAT